MDLTRIKTNFSKSENINENNSIMDTKYKNKKGTSIRIYRLTDTLISKWINSCVLTSQLSFYFSYSYNRTR